VAGRVRPVRYRAAFPALLLGDVRGQIVHWGNGTSAYYDDYYDLWYYVTPSANAPMAIDANFTFYFGGSYYGAGGLYQSWCSSHLANQSCSYTFQLGWGSWYDLDTLPAIEGYPQIFSDQIDEAWPTTANANQPNAEIPINMAEGSFTELSSQYGGGPRDAAQDYQDLLWVQTNALRVYVYQIWLFENR
jgi:hypothetical protein